MSQQSMLLDIMNHSHDYLRAGENSNPSRIGGLPEHILDLISICVELPESTVVKLTEKASYEKISQEIGAKRNRTDAEPPKSRLYMMNISRKARTARAHEINITIVVLKWDRCAIESMMSRGKRIRCSL